MNKQAGFTLVELVVVIVILGLLAATALPRFINVTTDARVASLNGVAGGLRSAAALARAEYVESGFNTETQITMDGQAVDVLAESANAGRGGRPASTATGIQVAMPNPDGYAVTISGGVVTYRPDSGGSATCELTYTAAAINDPVVVTDGGC